MYKKIEKENRIVLKTVGALVLITAAFFFWKGFFGFFEEEVDTIDSYSNQTSYSSPYDCNVATVSLRGDLVTYIAPQYDEEGFVLPADATASEDIDWSIRSNADDSSIEAIILEIDSLGGYPVAAEEVMNALRNTKKPTIALIRESGLSAAYYAAVGADYIFASKNSDLGSIGVTASYVDNVDHNNQHGFSFNELSSGKFKDVGNPNRKLTTEEKNLIQRDITILHNNFVKDVAVHRGLEVEEVEKFADGSSMLAERALEYGLIDKIGGYTEIENFLEESYPETDFVFCR